VSGAPTPAAEKDKGGIPPATSALPDQDFVTQMFNGWLLVAKTKHLTQYVFVKTFEFYDKYFSRKKYHNMCFLIMSHTTH
jgi:hypothetical protein